MQLNIISLDKVLFSAPVDMVTIPGTEGDFGVLPGHAPFISTIRPGVITIDIPGGQQKMVITGGIAEVVPERTTILADKVIDCAGLSDAEIASQLEAL